MKRLLSSLALVVFSVLGASGVASAQTYTCANAPATVSGNVTIGTAGTACTFSNAVSDSSGSITVLGSTITDAYSLSSGSYALSITGSSTVNVKALTGQGITVSGTKVTTTTITDSYITNITASSTTIVTTNVTAEEITMMAGTTIQTGTLNTTTMYGNVMLTSTGSITTKGITSQGFVNLNAQGSTGDVNVTGNVKATAGYVEVQSGRLTKISGTVTTTAQYGHVLLYAQTTLAAGAITGGPGGNIDLKANIAGGASTFVINPSGGGATNGINGTITAVGSGSVSNQASTVVYITNGPVSSSGSITVTNATDITVQGASGSRSGYIVIDAGQGTLTMPSGTMSANGPTGQGAGLIHLAAKTVAFPSGTSTLSASQAAGVSGTRHGVVIAAQTVTYGGLTLNANGDGSNTTDQAFVTLEPLGASTISDNMSPTSSYIYVSDNPQAAGAITYTGSSALNATANGSHAIALVSGYPASFSGTNVLFQSNGVTDNTVEIENAGTLTGITGLTFGNSGSVVLDASAAPSGTGGTLSFSVDKATVSSTSLMVYANGPTSGNGNGGTINFSTSTLSIGSNTTGSIASNGSTSGTGNGGNIYYYPNNTSTITLGSSPGQISFSSAPGSQGGTGGTVTIAGNTANINVAGSNAVNVSATGTTGNAGKIWLYGNPNTNFTGSSAVALAADGGSSSGNGGEIHIFGNGTLNIGSGPNSATLSAKGAGTGNMAGTVEINYANGLTVNGANVTVTASGNAAGGVINFHNLGTLTVTNGTTLSADSAGTGKAGSITLNQTAYTTMTLDGATISASGGCDTNNNCGVINISNVAAISAHATQIKANGTGNANAGKVGLVVSDSNYSMNLSSGAIFASAANTGNGNGGQITLSSNNQIILAPATLWANGAGSGSGGTVLVSVAADQPVTISPSSLFEASGGQTGAGGIVSINYFTWPNLLTGFVNTFFDVSSGTGVTNPSTFGGSISLNSVTCQNTLTSYSWPKSYWNCVNPGNATTLDGTPAQAASGLSVTNPNNPTLLTNIRMTIYVLKDINQFASFFGSANLPGSAGGYSFTESGLTFDSSLFENYTSPLTGYTTITSSLLTDTTVHEMGHGLDYSNGLPSAGTGPGSYAKAFQDDQAWLDAAGGGKPCLANGTGPFNGVVDTQTGQQFCSGGTLNNPNGMYTGLTNSQIAAKSTYTLGQNTEFGATGYMEAYAESFAYQQYGKGLTYPSGYFITTADGLFHQNFYQCTLSTAATLAGVTYMTPQYPCN